MDDSSDDEEEKNVKHDPDKVIKTEDGDIKQDPDQPAKLESGQRENETLAECKLRLVRGSTDQNRWLSQYLFIIKGNIVCTPPPVLRILIMVFFKAEKEKGTKS